MTFILSHSLPAGPEEDQITLFVNDFRVTRDSSGGGLRAADAVDKWECFGEQLAYAVAGPVLYWTRARTAVQEVLPDIDASTLFAEDSPFQEALRDAALDATDELLPEGRFGCLGVLLEGGEHHPFLAEGFVGRGAQVSPLSNGSVEIVGRLGLVGEGGKPAPADELVPLQKRIVERVRRMVCAERRLPNCDAASLAHAAREAVLHELERAGPRSFAELGISPAMATAAALDGGFATFGGEVSGFRTGAGGVFYETGYAIRKQEGGSIELQDFTSGKRNLLRTIAGTDEAGTDEALERGTVDPQLRTDTTDLAALFPARASIR